MFSCYLGHRFFLSVHCCLSRFDSQELYKRLYDARFAVKENFKVSCNPIAHRKLKEWALQDLNEKPQVAKSKDVTQSSPNPMVHNTVHQAHCQPELQELINRWDDLPEHVRQTIKMLIDTAGKSAD